MSEWTKWTHLASSVYRNVFHCLTDNKLCVHVKRLLFVHGLLLILWLHWTSPAHGFVVACKTEEQMMSVNVFVLCVVCFLLLFFSGRGKKQRSLLCHWIESVDVLLINDGSYWLDYKWVSGQQTGRVLHSAPWLSQLHSAKRSAAICLRKVCPP